MARRQQEYRTDQIVVRFDPSLCIHTGNCLRGLPVVFRRRESPWIVPAAASAGEIAEVVTRCPSGALEFERLDGGPAEEPQALTSIQPEEDGPVFVRGALEVLDPRGNVIRRATRVALCSCGGSANKPFCDLSHRAGAG